MRSSMQFRDLASTHVCTSVRFRQWYKWQKLLHNTTGNRHRSETNISYCTVSFNVSDNIQCHGT